MSNLPGQVFRFRDPGLGVAELSGATFLFIGASERGETNVVRAISSPAAIVDEYGQGPLSEAAALALDVAGGPVYLCRVPGTVPGATGPVTAKPLTASTGTLAAAGEALTRFDAAVEITRTGTLGEAEFRYSLDGERTWSEPRTVPLGGTYLVPESGVTLTFTPGAGPLFLELGDKFTFETTAPHYSTTELAGAIAALRTYFQGAPDFTLDAIVLTGTNETGSEAATVFGALDVHLTSLEAIYRYVGGIMDAGSADTRAAVKTAFASVASRRISVVYGEQVCATSKAFAGFGAPRTPLLNSVAARAGRVVVSTDLARFADGPLPGVLAITHDEFVTEEMDAAKFTTARTWAGVAGFYLTNARMKSPVGSDYLYWQHRRVMDVASRVTYAAQQQFVSAEFRTNPDGSIDEREAVIVEETVREALEQALLIPKNASGRAGQVTAIDYAVDRAANITSTQILPTTVAVQPLAYAKRLSTEIGFALNVTA